MLDNPYSAYDQSGRPRGPAFTTTWFKKAWRRIALVVRGATWRRSTSSCAARACPPVRTSADELPRPRIALMWVPLSFGNPEIEKNHPRHFWRAPRTSTGSAPPGTRCTATAPRSTPSTATGMALEAVRLRRVGHLGRRRAQLRRAVPRLPQVAPAGADGRLLPVGLAQARVRSRQPSRQPRGAAAGGQWPRLTGVAPQSSGWKTCGRRGRRPRQGARTRLRRRGRTGSKPRLELDRDLLAALSGSAPDLIAS